MCCLFSGGKDSTYACHWAFLKGFRVECLLTAKPSSRDSMLFHYPAISLTSMQAKAMNVEQVVVNAGGREEEALHKLFRLAADRYGAEGIVSGALLSDYQRLRFSIIAEEEGLKTYTPLWRKNQAEYMRSLIREGFEFIVVSISAMGLPPSILGKPITLRDVEDIIRLAEKYGFNPAFEGGEAETLVLDAPLFRMKLMVEGVAEREAPYVWRYRIMKARLMPKHYA